MNRRNELLARVYIVMMFFIFLTIWIIGKIAYINIVEGEKWKEKISRNIKWRDIQGDRGIIYSADESILANSTPRFEVRMDLLAPSDKDFNKNIDSLSYCISKYLNSEKSKAEWKHILIQGRVDGKTGRKKGMRYFLLQRNLNYEEITKVKKFPLFNKGKIKGGLIINRSTIREKPFKDLAGRTIGIDRKNATKVGLEAAYDKYLKGETAKRLYKRLLGGTWIPLQENDNRPLSKGADLITNINIKIQDIVHHEVLNKLMQTKAEAGVGIVMEVKTGKIVALTNLSKDHNGAYKERMNYAVQRKYAPGSVLKTATTMALLDDKFIDINSTIDLEGGKMNFRGKIVKDDEDIGHGKPVTLWDAFVHSSNVAMSKWADIYYNANKKARKNYILKLKSFGLSKTSGIDLLGETKPVVKDPDLNRNNFSRNTIPWMAHGYEIEMTPIQILTFYNAIANNGKIMKPYLVDKIVEENEIINIKQEVISNKIADDLTIKKIQRLLKGVVDEGTARSLRKNSTDIAGKTGTAQANIQTGNDEQLYNSTFAGYFPADNPKYSMIIVMYGNRKPQYYASQVAVPVFGKIVDKMRAIQAFDFEKETDDVRQFVNATLPGRAKGYSNDFEELMNYLNIPYKKRDKKNWTKVDKKFNQMEMSEFQLNRKTIPDVRGMGARDAVYILENLGLKVKLDGIGKVYTQSLPPGIKIKGQTIKLILK